MQVYSDYPLSDILWYRIGGVAKYLLECSSREDVLSSLEFIDTHNIEKTLVAGLGSNLLVSDDYFNGAVIRFVRTKNPASSITINSEIINAFAGEVLDDVIQASFKHSLIGLEWAGGIPGTVGAGVSGNVGAFGGEIKDYIISVDVIDLNQDNREIFTINKNDLDFIYRGSRIKTQKNLLVMSACFKLIKGEEKNLLSAQNIYHSNIRYREERHPLEYPSCGSTFKNIVDPKQVNQVLSVYPDITENVQTKWYGKVSIASVIEKLGFSGYKVGNAQVSAKHANFIVNLGGARFFDVFTIIQAIKEEFYDTFGFDPQTEVEIVQ